MILGSDIAKVGHGLRGETFRRTIYRVEIDGKAYNLHDTVGLGAHSGGTVDNRKAVRNLYRLLTDLSSSGGVNLLVFVLKRGRLTDSIHKNYTLFHHGVCDSNVPIVIVVTSCENDEPTMDTWWIKNEAPFTAAGMLFDGHAGVCANKGRKTKTGGYSHEGLVEESAEMVKQLVVQHCMSNGWVKVRNPSRCFRIYRQTSNLATGYLALQCHRIHDRPVSFIKNTSYLRQPLRSPDKCLLSVGSRGNHGSDITK